MRTVLRAILSIGASLSLLGAAQAQQVAIGTNPQGSLGYSIAAAAASVISDYSGGVEAVAVPGGGSSGVLPQLNNGEMEFGTSNTIEAYYAVNGVESFEGRPLENVRVAAVLTPFQLGLLVREDSDIESLSDLQGRRMPSGFSSQVFIGAFLRATLAAEGMDGTEFDEVPVPNFARSIELLTAGRLDAAFAAPGSGLIRQADADVGIRYLSLNPVEGAEEKIQAIAPGAYLVEVEPTEANAGVKSPSVLMGYEYTLMVGAHVPDEVVYNAVKSLHEHPEELTNAHSIYGTWDPDRIFLPIDAPYHPGAIKYFKEIEIWQEY